MVLYKHIILFLFSSDTFLEVPHWQKKALEQQDNCLLEFMMSKLNYSRGARKKDFFFVPVPNATKNSYFTAILHFFPFSFLK